MSSESYWRKREEEALQHYIKDEKEYDKRIKEIYQNMLDEAQADIDHFFSRYADKEGITIAEAKKRVSKADIAHYERKAKKYVKQAAKDRLANGGQTDYTGAYFSEKANQEMRLYNLMMKVNRLEMLKAQIGLSLIKGHAELEQFMEEILRGRTETELIRQAGILGKTIRVNAKMVHSIVNASFHNATFSDRIWANQAVMKADLSKLLQSGLIQGKGARELAKDLRKYYIGADRLKNGKKGAKYVTERLMRTELARVQTDAQVKSYEEMGFDMFTFHANYGCCEKCEPLDEKHFKLSKLQIGKNAPPIHPLCRCAISPYEDDDEYEEWLDYLDKGGTTEEWNKLKNREKSFAKKFDSGIIKEKKVLESKAYYSAIKAEEKKIYKDNVETAVLFDNRGNVIFRESSGASNYVKFSKEQLSRMQGATLTHNHPSSSTFSPADIAIVTEQRLEVIRATGALKTYQLKEIKGAKVNHAFSIDYEKAMNENKKITDKEFRTYKKQYKQGKLSPLEYQEKINMLNKKWNDMNSDWLKKNSKNYGYRYGVIERGK